MRGPHAQTGGRQRRSTGEAVLPNHPQDTGRGSCSWLSVHKVDATRQVYEDNL